MCLHIVRSLAAACAESLAGQAVAWPLAAFSAGDGGGGLSYAKSAINAPPRRLSVQFCPGLPADCPARARDGAGRLASHYVWVAVLPHRLELPTPDEIMGPLHAAGLPAPPRMLSVAGSFAGALLADSLVTCLPSSARLCSHI
jgi:hypothetical protein